LFFLHLGGYGGQERDEYQEPRHHKHHVRLVFKNLQRGIAADKYGTIQPSNIGKKIKKSVKKGLEKDLNTHSVESTSC
jgi:hypothetical protein